MAKTTRQILGAATLALAAGCGDKTLPQPEITTRDAQVRFLEKELEESKRHTQELTAAMQNRLESDQEFEIRKLLTPEELKAFDNVYPKLSSAVRAYVVVIDDAIRAKSFLAKRDVENAESAFKPARELFQNQSTAVQEALWEKLNNDSIIPGISSKLAAIAHLADPVEPALNR